MHFMAVIRTHVYRCKHQPVSWILQTTVRKLKGRRSENWLCWPDCACFSLFVLETNWRRLRGWQVDRREDRKKDGETGIILLLLALSMANLHFANNKNKIKTWNNLLSEHQSLFYTLRIVLTNQSQLKVQLVAFFSFIPWSSDEVCSVVMEMDILTCKKKKLWFHQEDFWHFLSLLVEQFSINVKVQWVSQVGISLFFSPLSAVYIKVIHIYILSIKLSLLYSLLLTPLKICHLTIKFSSSVCLKGGSGQFEATFYTYRQWVFDINIQVVGGVFN